MDQLLNQKQAARILGLSVRTLERHRVAGTGPRYVRLGHVIRCRPSAPVGQNRLIALERISGSS